MDPLSLHVVMMVSYAPWDHQIQTHPYENMSRSEYQIGQT